MLLQALCIISSTLVYSNWSYRPETSNLGQNRRFLCRVTLTFDRWPWKTIGHLFFATSSFVHHFIAIGIQTGVTVRKRSIRVKIDDVPCDIEIWQMTLKNNWAFLDRWHWKTIGHLFYATSNFVHHLVAIGEFKLELQSGNTQFGSKSTIFCAVWPWNLSDDFEKQKANSPYQH